jgi:mycothiol system anti-sigma-R factor
MKPNDLPASGAPMPDCEAVMRQLWDYLDRQLTPDTMASIQRHLDHCSKCRPHADYRRAFERAVAGARIEAGDTDPLRDRIRAALQAADRDPA